MLRAVSRPLTVQRIVQSSSAARSIVGVPIPSSSSPSSLTTDRRFTAGNFSVINVCQVHNGGQFSIIFPQHRGQRRTLFGFGGSKAAPVTSTTTDKDTTATAAPAGTSTASFDSSPDGKLMGDNDAVAINSLHTFDTADTSNTASVEETLDKLFAESHGATTTTTTTDLDGSSLPAQAPDDVWQFSDAAAVAGNIEWTPVWWYPSDNAINLVLAVQDATSMPYGWAIVSSTFLLRIFLFPVMIKSQRNTMRMAHANPEITLMRKKMDDGDSSQQDKVKYANQIKAVFKKYECSPFGGIILPLVQLPMFMGMFFGMRKLPNIMHDELVVGGMLWFPDLTMCDPIHVLPILASATFIAVGEQSRVQALAANPQTGTMMLNFIRFSGVIMIPICFNLPSAMLLYWCTNNIITLGQTYALQQKSVRKRFDIWDAPKPVPGSGADASAASITQTAKRVMKKMQGLPSDDLEKMKRHNKEVDAKKKAKAFGMMRRAREERGIMGKKSKV